MNVPADLWGKILSMLERDLTPVTISTWFADASIVDLTDNVLILYTPVPFKRSILQDRFTDLLKRTAGELLFTDDLEIRILCGDAELNAYRSSAVPEQPDENMSYTFSEFVVGSSNRFAHAAAVAVSKNPASTYNPLFIYGPSGLGKTHLLYAISGVIRMDRPHYRIVYVKGDDFTNELITSIQTGTVAEFRSKYRMADLLLVDDIQFIAGKESTQEEFFHTFNALFEAKKQIVLTSDRTPNEIATLEDRLRTRFEWGLIADIQPPDYETRRAIIHAKAERLHLDIPDEVSEHIAKTLASNVRQLEGAVKKIQAQHDLMGVPIDINLANTAIRDLMRENPGIKPTPEYIVRETAKFYSITPDKIYSLSRSKDTVMPRQIAMYLIRELTDLSLPMIGQVFKRDHTTVMHSINKIEELMRSNEETRRAVKDLTSNIKNL